MQQEYRPVDIETSVQKWWHEQNSFRAVENSEKEKILLPSDVSLSQWPTTYGPCAQLYNW